MIPESTRHGLVLVLAAAIAMLGIALAPAPVRADRLATLPGAAPFPAPLRRQLEKALAAEAVAEGPRAPGAAAAPRYTNRLLLAASPYLRRHAHNPVDWRPWDEESLAAARRSGRPIFVSVGYATCHGCRVMEEESFSDPAVATLLNERFVAIKVDRVAQPDVAEQLARFAAAMQVEIGWPLHVFLTPDGQPFYGANFIPRRDEPGRPGILTVLTSAADAYASEPAGLTRRAEQLARGVQSGLATATAAPTSAAPGPQLLTRGARALLASVDPEWGGIAGVPKLPLRPSVRLLLRYARRSGDEAAREAALRGLDRMASGALRDPLDGGFFRLASDRRWQMPQFEKSLADNAALALGYLEAWQVTGRTEFADVAREALDFAMRALTAPAGGFYAALDAESRDAEGVLRAGAFYTWTASQIRAALDPALARVAIARFSAGDAATPLDRRRPLRDVAQALDLSESALAVPLAQARAALLAARAARPAPAVDDQVLTAWNGLTVSALARVGFALEEPALLARARETAAFLLRVRLPDGRLARAWSAGRSEGPGLLEDYALLVAGLLDLSEVDPDPRWLEQALALQRVLESDYADPAGGYTRSARDAEPQLLHERPVRDGVVPAGNAVVAANLERLHALTGDPAYRERAAALFRALGPAVAADPAACSEMLVALDAHLESFAEVVIVHPAAVSPAPMLAPLRRLFVPNRVLLVTGDGSESARVAALAPLAAHRKPLEGRTTAYVCRDHICKSPTTDPAVLAEQLRQAKPLAATD